VLRVIVFTKRASLAQVKRPFAKRHDVRILDEIQILHFDESSSTFQPATNFLESGLYLVFDGITGQRFTDLLSPNNDPELFILTHTHPEIERLQPFTPNVIRGENTSLGMYYPNLVSILMDEEAEKLDRIIKKVFKSDTDYEENLNLLISLFPETSDSNKSLEDQIRKLGDTPKPVSSESGANTYNEKLTLLRDVWIGS
jgi:hypothetical protein